MDLKIDPEAVQEVVKLAIIEQLGAEGRERLVAHAVTHLLEEPKSTNYGVKLESPLMRAFNQAAAAAAQTIVFEEVAKDPVFVAKVKEKVGEALAKMDELNYSHHVAQALASAMAK